MHTYTCTQCMNVLIDMYQYVNIHCTSCTFWKWDAKMTKTDQCKYDCHTSLWKFFDLLWTFWCTFVFKHMLLLNKIVLTVSSSKIYSKILFKILYLWKHLGCTEANVNADSTYLEFSQIHFQSWIGCLTMERTQRSQSHHHSYLKFFIVCYVKL